MTSISSHTHWQVAQADTQTKTYQRVCLPNADKKEKNKKHERPTKAIRNAGKMLNMHVITINKISGNLKNNRFKIPHYA